MSRILLIFEGCLDAEQKKQVTFMRRAAEGLFEMLNHLLDTVKADSEKWDVDSAPDLIVFDVMLPDILGFEVCRIIKGKLSQLRFPSFTCQSVIFPLPPRFRVSNFVSLVST